MTELLVGLIRGTPFLIGVLVIILAWNKCECVQWDTRRVMGRDIDSVSFFFAGMLLVGIWFAVVIFSMPDGSDYVGWHSKHVDFHALESAMWRLVEILLEGYAFVGTVAFTMAWGSAVKEWVNKSLNDRLDDVAKNRVITEYKSCLPIEAKELLRASDRGD